MPAPMTARIAEFLSQPEEKPYREYMDGEVVPGTMPTKLHSRTVGILLQWLWNFVEANPGPDVDTERRHLDRESEWVFLPDISVTLSPGAPTSSPGPVEVMPDFAIEILSPTDTGPRTARKIAHYMRAGVTTLWVIDPESETVTVWERGELPRVLEHAGSLSASPVLQGFTVDLKVLFDRVHGR